MRLFLLFVLVLVCYSEIISSSSSISSSLSSNGIGKLKNDNFNSIVLASKTKQENALIPPGDASILSSSFNLAKLILGTTFNLSNIYKIKYKIFLYMKVLEYYHYHLELHHFQMIQRHL